MATLVQQIAEFAERLEWDDLSQETQEQLKLRVLDALACAAGAIGMETPARVLRQIETLGG